MPEAPAVPNARTCFATFEGISPYSSSRYTKGDFPKGPKESDAQYDERIWKHKAHHEGDVVVAPAMAFKRALEEAAKGTKVPNKGNYQFPNFIKRGVMVPQNVPIGRVEDLEPETLFVPSSGQAGSGTRVHKTFPVLFNWGGVARFVVIDPLLHDTHPDYVADFITGMGRYIGIGRFRPENGGIYGRFKVTDISWKDGEA